MYFYIAPLLLALCFSVVGNSKCIEKTILNFSLMCFFVFFIGLRYAAVDYFTYENIFDYVVHFNEIGFPNYTPSSGEKPVESLFAVIILLTKFLGGNFSVFVFLTAILAVTTKFYSICRMSSHIGLSLLLYVALWMGKDLGQMRNGLASGVTLLSIIYVYDRKYIKFIFSAFASMLFHLIGVLTLPLYFIRYFSNFKFMVIIFTLSLFIALCGGGGQFIGYFLTEYFSLDDSYRIIRYLNSRFATGYSLLGGTFLLHFVVTCVSLVYFKKLSAINSYNSILIPVHVYGFSIMMFFIDYGIIFARVKDLLCVPVLIVFLPSFLLLFDRRSRSTILLLLLLLIFYLFYVYYPTLPYQNILGVE